MLKGTLIGIAAIVGFIVVIVAAAVIALTRALDKSGNSPSPPPRAQLVPVGQPAEIGHGWRLKVLRVTPTAEREARVAEKAHPPPNGTRYFLVNLTLTYTGSGRGDPGDLLSGGLEAIGAHGALYDDDNSSCGHYVPKPNPYKTARLSQGQATSGYDCYEIQASDARTLVLHTGDFSSLLRTGVKGLHDRWFALH